MATNLSTMTKKYYDESTIAASSFKDLKSLLSYANSEVNALNKNSASSDQNYSTTAGTSQQHVMYANGNFPTSNSTYNNSTSTQQPTRKTSSNMRKVTDVNLAANAHFHSMSSNSSSSSSKNVGDTGTDLEKKPSMEALLSLLDSPNLCSTLKDIDKKKTLDAWRGKMNSLNNSGSDHSSYASPKSDPNNAANDPQNSPSLRRMSSMDILKSLLKSCDSSGSLVDRKMTSNLSFLEGLNSTLEGVDANNAIHQNTIKPMSSVDSFRFQHLQNCINSIEKNSSTYNNMEYSNDNEDGEVYSVSVENLDNLLDDKIPGQPSRPAQPAAHQPDAPYYYSTNPGNDVLLPGLRSLRNNYTHGSPIQPNSAQTNYDMGTPPNLSFNNYGNGSINRFNSNSNNGTYYDNNGAGVGRAYQEPMPKFNVNSQVSYQQPVPANMPFPSNHQLSVNCTQNAPIASSTPTNKLCSVNNCNNICRSKGLCKSHGGGRQCKVEGCMKSAQTGHLCIAHGGGKPCQVESCQKTAQSRGLCKMHGGGVRCKHPGCSKSCQSGGFCRGHGGGKRCQEASCKKWAQRNGLCAKHAQEIAKRGV